jgi:hypothetical protein
VSDSYLCAKEGCGRPIYLGWPSQTWRHEDYTIRDHLALRLPKRPAPSEEMQDKMESARDELMRAAAPDLYAALEALEPYYHIFQIGAQEIVRAALAKARGESA